MATKHIGHHDALKNDILFCPKCGWSGTFMQGSVDHHDEMMDSSCPACAPLEAPLLATAILTYPSLEEMEANFDKLSDFHKAEVTSRQRFVAEFEGRCLRAADQLPDLSAEHITLSWDFTGEGAGNKQTVIRNGEQVVWSEPAVWEGYERFPEVLSILKQKYGARLFDVVPTPASELYLYGDRAGAIAVVTQARSELQGHEGG